MVTTGRLSISFSNVRIQQRDDVEVFGPIEPSLLLVVRPRRLLALIHRLQGARLGPVVRQLLVHFLVRLREPKINVLQFLQFLGS